MPLLPRDVQVARPCPRGDDAVDASYNGDQPRADRCHRRESGDNGPGQLSLLGPPIIWSGLPTAVTNICERIVIRPPVNWIEMDGDRVWNEESDK